MRTTLGEQSRADLRRTLGEMESLAPIAPEWKARPVGFRRQSRNGRRQILVALGAAAAVFALVLPVALLSGTPDVSDTTGSAPPSTQVGTTTPGTEPTTAQLVEGWGFTEVSRLGTVIGPNDQGFVAITSDEIRIADNGIEWHTSGRLDDGAFVTDIDWRDGTLVAAGAIVSVDDSGTRIHSPAIWASTDGGVTWSRTDLGVTDVTATSDGFVAVGIEKRDDSDPTYNKTRGVVWTSGDGLTWTRVAATEDPEGISSAFRNVVWDDRIVILGHRGPDYVSEGSGLEDPEPHENVTWFSYGTDLSEPTPSNLVGNLDPDQTAVTPHGIIAMTHWMTPAVKTVAAAWISDDGTTWTELNIDSGNYEYTDIGQIGDEVFITGYELLDRGADGVDTAVWSSRDATSWTRLDLPELPDGTRLTQVEVTESALVMAGDHSTTGVIISRRRN